MNQLATSLIIKTLFGTVLTGAMIISVFNVSQDLHEYLYRFEAGLILQILLFTMIFAACAASLLYLFRKKEMKSDSERADEAIAVLMSCDNRILALKAAEVVLVKLTKEFEKK